MLKGCRDLFLSLPQFGCNFGADDAIEMLRFYLLESKASQCARTN